MIYFFWKVVSCFIFFFFLNLNSRVTSSAIFVPRILYSFLIFFIFIRRKQLSIIYQSFTCKYIFYESDTIKTTHNRFIMLCSKYILSNWLIFDFFNTSRGIYSNPKESKYTAAFPSINNETQCVHLLFLSWRFIL